MTQRLAHFCKTLGVLAAVLLGGGGAATARLLPAISERAEPTALCSANWASQSPSGEVFLFSTFGESGAGPAFLLGPTTDLSPSLWHFLTPVGFRAAYFSQDGKSFFLIDLLGSLRQVMVATPDQLSTPVRIEALGIDLLQGLTVTGATPSTTLQQEVTRLTQIVGQLDRDTQRPNQHTSLTIHNGELALVGVASPQRVIIHDNHGGEVFLGPPNPFLTTFRVLPTRVGVMFSSVNSRWFVEREPAFEDLMERHLAVDSFAAPLLDESTGQSTVGWHPRMQLVEDARIETSLPVSEWPALQVRGNRGAMIALHTDHLRRNTTVRVTSPDEHNWKIDCRNPQVGRHQRPGPHSGITILEEAAVPLPPVTLAAVTPEGAHTVAGVLLSPLDGDRELVIIVVGGPGAQATRQIGGTLEADLLRAGFAVLIVDYGGSAGATPLGANGLRLRGPTGLAEDAGALAQLSQGIAQHYGYGQTHILADSFGALMAQELAQQLEGSLSSMVLLVPWTHYRDPSEWVDPLGRNPEALSPGQKARVMEARAHEVAVFGSRINNPSSPWNAYFSGLYQDCSAFPPTLFVLAEIDPKSQPADLTSCLRTGNATVSVVPRVTHELVVAPAETREMIISFLRR